MATDIVPITRDAWTLISTGPQPAVAIQATTRAVVYTIQAAIPGSITDGHTLTSDTGHTISLESSENIYARTEFADTGELIRTV